MSSPALVRPQSLGGLDHTHHIIAQHAMHHAKHLRERIACVSTHQGPNATHGRAQLTNTNDDTPRDAHTARTRDARIAGTRNPERQVTLCAIGGAKRGVSGTALRQKSMSAGRAASCNA